MEKRGCRTTFSCVKCTTSPNSRGFCRENAQPSPLRTLTVALLRTNEKRPSPYGEGRFGAFDYSDT